MSKLTWVGGLRDNVAASFTIDEVLEMLHKSGGNKIAKQPRREGGDLWNRANITEG